jgi:hypothetical protein
MEKKNTQGLPTDFHNGFHWRHWGMDPILRGAVAKPEMSPLTVNVWITTEGVFSDIDGEGNVLYFTAQRQAKLFVYVLTETGEATEVRETTIQEATKHIDRTTCTQWTIELEKESYEALDLSGFTGLDTHYHGRYMPIKPPGSRRDSAVAV